MEMRAVRQALLKICQRHELAEMIYMRADGAFTKRRIRILAVDMDSFTAYCHLRHEKRTFTIDRVLSIQRVVNRERQAI
jgi:predicted DNA-binding transcriptional regulator YafY